MPVLTLTMDRVEALGVSRDELLRLTLAPDDTLGESISDRLRWRAGRGRATHLRSGGWIVMGTITQAEASLVLRVLQHARDDEPRQRLRGVLRLMEHGDSAFQAISISRSEATLVWEDVLALRHLLATEAQPAVDSLKASLAAIMRTGHGEATTISS
jgi:hypothetical protein